MSNKLFYCFCLVGLAVSPFTGALSTSDEVYSAAESSPRRSEPRVPQKRHDKAIAARHASTGGPFAADDVSGGSDRSDTEEPTGQPEETVPDVTASSAPVHNDEVEAAPVAAEAAATATAEYTEEEASTAEALAECFYGACSASSPSRPASPDGFVHRKPDSSPKDSPSKSKFDPKREERPDHQEDDLASQLELHMATEGDNQKQLPRGNLSQESEEPIAEASLFNRKRKGNLRVEPEPKRPYEEVPFDTLIFGSDEGCMETTTPSPM